jgi:hypothetical protein
MVQYLVKEFTDVHLLLYAFTGMVAAVFIGYLASFLGGAEREKTVKYTISALHRSD